MNFDRTFTGISEAERAISEDRLDSSLSLGGGRIRVLESAVTATGGFTLLARKRNSVYRSLQSLARVGLLQCDAGDGWADFVHRTRVSDEWEAVRDGRLQVAEGLAYKLILPEPPEVVRRLLVVLSGVPGDCNQPRLDRYFNYDYGYSEKYRTGDTAILRIADVGGVLGAFYRDTWEDPMNREKVTALILSVIERLGLDRSRACILGTSKGGVGAVLHGLHCGIAFIANDPVISEDYDSGGVDEYFLGRSVYSRRIEEDVREALASGRARDSRAVFLTSPASAHFENVRSLAALTPGASTLFVSRDPSITRHSQVAGAMLALAISTFNSLLHGLPVATGEIDLSKT